VATHLENLENLEKSGNLKVVREKSGKMEKVMEKSGETEICFYDTNLLSVKSVRYAQIPNE